MAAKNLAVSDLMGSIFFNKLESYNLPRRTNRRVRKRLDWIFTGLTSGTNPLYAFYCPIIQAILK